MTQSTAPRPHAPAPGPSWTAARLAGLALCMLIAAGLGIGFGVIITYLGEIPLAADLKAYQPSLATKVYDRHGKLVTELFSEQRTLVTLDRVPKYLQQAILAIEDDNFYHHFGIELSGIVRSFMVNFLHKSYKQGGSTITQQLARNMFLTMRKTIERKLKEIILALQIERMYTKDEILEMYLNQIYLGNGAYGVESAARAYFGKHVEDLTLPEAALLAGLPQAPNTFNPYRNPEKSKVRRNLVLNQMRKLGFISTETAETAQAAPIALKSIEVSEAPYFVEYVRIQLEERYGSNAIYKGGLKVMTTLDLDIQRIAQDALNEGLAEAETVIRPPEIPGQLPEPLQCALVLMDPKNGSILALIGGRDFTDSKFNRAVQAQRQPGSAFKPFVYTAAIEQGFTQADIILDAPVIYHDEDGQVWKPSNFSNRFYGPTTLRMALTKSRNVVTVKLLEKVGVRKVIDAANRLGIHSTLKPFLTLALGASEVNLLELVSAFGCFANHGIRVEPYSIIRVEDAEVNVLEENVSLREEAMSETTAFIMTDLLQSVVNRGTGYTLRRLGFSHPAGGKTGTTNDYSDAWFVGFTSEYVLGVWLGLDSHRSLGRGITGGKVAAPIWAKVMLALYQNRAPAGFQPPEGVSMVTVCQTSGRLARPECGSQGVPMAFAVGTEPTGACDVHREATATGHAVNLNLSPDLADVSTETVTLEDESDETPDETSPPVPPWSLPREVPPQL